MISLGGASGKSQAHVENVLYRSIPCVLALANLYIQHERLPAAEAPVSKPLTMIEKVALVKEQLGLEKGLPLAEAHNMIGIPFVLLSYLPKDDNLGI